MPSTYSPDLRIELIANGEQSGTWGATTNTNLGTLIEDSISGLASILVTSANQALTALNGAVDQARNAAIDLTTSTTANFAVYVPPVTKLYVVRNSSAYTATVYCSTVLGNTTAGGTGVAIPAGKSVLLRADGVNVIEQINYVSGAFSMGGNTTIGTRLSGTYTQTAATVTVTTTNAHGYTNGETVAFINVSGLGVSGAYVITYINTTSFSFTSGVSQSTSGNCYVTNTAITLNGIVQPGVIVEGSSTDSALRVTQTGTGLALLVEDSANPDTTPFAVTASGNVGIGVSAPAQLLDIASNTVAIDQISRYSTDVSAPARVIRKARGTAAAPTIVASDDGAGTVAFQAYDGVAFQPVAQIEALVDGTPGAGDMPGRLSLSTVLDGTATLVERIRVNNAGNTIIGSGEASATPVGNTLRAPNAAGTDISGSNLVIAAGNSTGTGVSGSVVIQTANPGTTGATANIMVDRITVQPDGLLFNKYSSLGAGVIPGQLYYRLSTTHVGANVNVVQSLFNVGVPLAANTTYAFEMLIVLQKTSGSTGHNISLLFDIGTGVFSDISYMVSGVFKGNPVTSINSNTVVLYSQVATATQVTSSQSNTDLSFIGFIKGTMSISTAGTWTPQYKLNNTPGGAYSTLAGSYVNVYPLGSSGAAINNGGWV